MLTEQNREIVEEKRYDVAGDEQSEVGENDQNLPMEMEHNRDFSAQREGTPVFHFTESQATPVVHFTESEMMMTLHHSAPPAITHLQMEEENNNYRQDTKLPISDPLLEAMLMERDSFEMTHYSDPLLEAMLMERDSFEMTHYSHVATKCTPASLEQKTLANTPPTKSLGQKVDAVYRKVKELREELSENRANIYQTMKVLKYEVLAMKGALRRQLTDSTAVKLLQTEEDQEEEPANQSDEYFEEENEDFEEENENSEEQDEDSEEQNKD